MSRGMPEGWYVIRVELLSGRGDVLDPPPGRDLLVSPHHTFRQLADRIDAGFARWDLGHLYGIRMADGTEIGIRDDELPVRDGARRYHFFRPRPYDGWAPTAKGVARVGATGLLVRRDRLGPCRPS